MNITEVSSFALPNVGLNPHKTPGGEKFLCEIHNLISPNDAPHTHSSGTVNSHTTDFTIKNTNVSCSGYRGCCSSQRSIVGIVVH
jgi:hypothetical protein